jgi:2-polyprenyl-3-methyl-5-hydroxy-6-metoxy-1,4-benzoquinol methylase
MTTFNPKEYWENRLQKSFNLHGVGDIGLGVNYNNALYEVRKFAFHKLMKRLKMDFSTKKVMDIGSGTGFYIERWKELDVASIHGTDITNLVVENLAKQFPEDTFTQLDIGEKIENPTPQYDFISAFDVLFHIVDDARFEQAIKNINGLLNDKGYFVISDNFVHGETKRLEHQVSRSHEYMISTIEKTGFKHVKTIPMFVLMNDPVDTNNRFIKKIFWLITKNVRKGEKKGKVIGNLIKPIEKLLISLKTESPSTEIKVFQKI